MEHEVGASSGDDENHKLNDFRLAENLGRWMDPKDAASRAVSQFIFLFASYVYSHQHDRQTLKRSVDVVGIEKCMVRMSGMHTQVGINI